MEETWRTIKQLLNKRFKSTLIDLLNDKGTEVTTKKEISNVMKNISVLLVKTLQVILMNALILYFQANMIPIH